MGVEIPLFPLGIVLFPHMPLSLHIFEQRYRAMVRDCMAEHTSFGIVALRDGHDGTGSTAPYPVGTLAQLRDVDALPDGRFRLKVTGASRFRVEDLLPGKPYLRASIRYLQDRPGGDEPDRVDLARHTVAAFGNYASLLGELNDEAAAEIPSREDPELLSYVVCAALQVEVAVRQALLEMDSVIDRLRLGLSLLRRENAILAAMLERRDDPVTAFSRN